MVTPPLLVTATSLPSSTAATPAWVAIMSVGSVIPAVRTWVTWLHAPPASGRRSSVPDSAQPPCAGQVAVSARTCPSITARDSIEPPGEAALVQCCPPSVVCHSPSPKTNPCSGVAKRMPHTPVPPGDESGTTGAGSPRQLAPWSSVQMIDVHGACEHGAVPRTKASCVDTNVTDVALNPPGTGPPGGGAGLTGVPGVTDGAAIGVAAGVRAAAGRGRGPAAGQRQAGQQHAGKDRRTRPCPDHIERCHRTYPLLINAGCVRGSGAESPAGNQGDQGQEPGCQGCGRDGGLRGSPPAGPRAQDHAAGSLSSFSAIAGPPSPACRTGTKGPVRHDHRTC